MADLKISQLTGASTPLAGTEVLPIVQSSSTVKVSVANLTAGRTQTSNGIVQGTAATGYNFTANTPAAGMTSQLLNWYEEGTWTGTMVGTTTNPTTPVTATGRYTRIGRNVTIAITFANVDTTGASGSLRINGAPFTASAEQCLGTVFTLGFTATAPVCNIVSGTQISVIEAATGADIAMSAASGKYLGLTLTYFV